KTAPAAVVVVSVVVVVGNAPEGPEQHEFQTPPAQTERGFLLGSPPVKAAQKKRTGAWRAPARRHPPSRS
ncbi:ilvB operon leader peptide IvbL, partial [Pseudomonas aeruginosa]|uniref:ilvB operon leader peptide IvbL n=1 Tax=Pseudomonas aeruginosa TaxID=287 RepID=UPI00396A6F78